MLQRRVASRTLPLPATQHITMCAVVRGELEVNRRHPGTVLAVRRSRPPTFEQALHVIGLILVHEIREQTAGGVPMIAGDDQPPPRTKPFNQ